MILYENPEQSPQILPELLKNFNKSNEQKLISLYASNEKSEIEIKKMIPSH